MKQYLKFWKAMIRAAFQGSTAYYLWLAALGLPVAMGLVAWIFQLKYGLQLTHMSDQVSWGAYIANFTFLVGVGAAAVLLVVPSYLYRREDIREVVFLGELVAFTAITLCLMFVTVDLGRPERFLHMLPFIGRLNFPQSILAWDVIVLTGYLLLNMHIPGYLLYRHYLQRRPSRRYYLPFVYMSIGWAISIHTVTAFLYSGFGGRPYWNTAIMAPRFLISAFASGPAILILVFTIVQMRGVFPVKASVIDYLKNVIKVALPLNFFLLACELFKEIYTGSTHALSVRYLFLGIDGHQMIAPYIWGSLLASLVAMVIFLVPRLRQNQAWLLTGCGLTIIGVWIEKGMGVIIPGFIPSPLGDLVEYTPSVVEFMVSLGIWSFGALMLTVLIKVASAIERGDLVASKTDQ